MSGSEIKWGIREELFRQGARRQRVAPPEAYTICSEERRVREPNKAAIRLTRRMG